MIELVTRSWGRRLVSKFYVRINCVTGWVINCRINRGKDPCWKENKLSMRCLDENGDHQSIRVLILPNNLSIISFWKLNFFIDYDKGKCQAEFENYRSCKGFWNSVSWARRKEVGFISTYYLLPPRDPHPYVKDPILVAEGPYFIQIWVPISMLVPTVLNFYLSVFFIAPNFQGLYPLVPVSEEERAAFKRQYARTGTIPTTIENS